MSTPSEHAANADTTSQDTQSPIAAPVKSGAPPMQIQRLKAYLDEHHPAGNDPSRPLGEHPVDTAIRLLSAQAMRTSGARCGEQYCNQPSGHAGEHGIVHYQSI